MLKLSFPFQKPSAIDRFNPPLTKPSSTLVDTTRFTSGNPTLVTGRHSPVYVAVPVDRPPVKLKPRARATAQDTIDISAINELRSKLLNVDDSGYTNRYYLESFVAFIWVVTQRISPTNKCCVTFQLMAIKKTILN